MLSLAQVAWLQGKAALLRRVGPVVTGGPLVSVGITRRLQS